MARIRALIVDDEPLVRSGLKALLSEERDFQLIGECRNGAEALVAIRQHRPDLVFLDVQMPRLDGLGVVAALEPTELPAIVFVTAYDEYATKAFDVEAIDYLLKPFDEERFRAALGRVRARLGDGGGEVQRRLLSVIERLRPGTEFAERLMIRTGGKMVFVPVAEIDWIEAADNYVRLHAGGAQHLLRETIKALESRLDPRRFVRIHRSTMVNIERVRELEPTFNGEYVVRLQGGTKLTLSRGYRDAFQERMG